MQNNSKPGKRKTQADADRACGCIQLSVREQMDGSGGVHNYNYAKGSRPPSSSCSSQPVPQASLRKDVPFDNGKPSR